MEPRPITNVRAFERAFRRNMSKRGQRKVNALFRKFNRRFFGGRLPAYTVEMVPTLLRPRNRGEGGGSVGLDAGRCMLRERMIFLNAAALWDSDDLRETLTHEMIHATGIIYHGERFAVEARRIEEMGAWVRNDDLFSRREMQRFAAAWRKSKRGGVA